MMDDMDDLVQIDVEPQTRPDPASMSRDDLIRFVADHWRYYAAFSSKPISLMAAEFQIPSRRIHALVHNARVAGILPASERATRKGIPVHGTRGRYINWGCRCGVCRAAEVSYKREQRTKPPSPKSHGTPYNYSRGCRCDTCTQANSATILAVHRRRQAESLASAHNKGKEWTGPELEIALRTDLTIPQIAERLGRTVWAVRAVRQKVRRGDPATMLLLQGPK